MNQPKMAVLHCADTPAHMDIGVKEIAEWHKKRGFLTVGYHWVIRRDGTLEKGRDELEQGAHVEGFNRNSLGVCLVGGRGPDPLFTDAQLATLDNLYLGILARWGLGPNRWKGHTELNPHKTCPNIDMDLVRDRLSKL